MCSYTLSQNTGSDADSTPLQGRQTDGMVCGTFADRKEQNCAYSVTIGKNTVPMKF